MAGEKPKNVEQELTEEEKLHPETAFVILFTAKGIVYNFNPKFSDLKPKRPAVPEDLIILMIETFRNMLKEEVVAGFLTAAHKMHELREKAEKGIVVPGMGPVDLGDLKTGEKGG